MAKSGEDDEPVKDEGIELGAGRHQLLHDLEVAVLGGHVEGCEPILVRLVDVHLLNVLVNVQGAKATSPKTIIKVKFRIKTVRNV